MSNKEMFKKSCINYFLWRHEVTLIETKHVWHIFMQNLIIPRSCVLEFFTVSRFRRARIDCYKTGNGRTELPYKVKVSISFCFSYITVYQAYFESVRNTVKLKNKKRNNAIYLNPSCKDWKWLPTKWIALKTYCIKCQSTM